MFNKLMYGALFMIYAGVITSCFNNSFSGSGKANQSTPSPSPSVNNSNVVPTQPYSPTQPGTVPPNLRVCSENYYVPATSNPYLAGVANGISITYSINAGDPPNPIDTAPAQNPVLVTPTDPSCLAAGTTIYFKVYGTVSYNSAKAGTDANGEIPSIAGHQKNGMFGKSNVIAPLNSMLGVFLGPGDPSMAAIPPTLDFSTQASRDYTVLQPQLGQIFFIGTGVTGSSTGYHQVVVPQGAASLYLAIMDTYQWNNNAGGLNGAIMVVK